jgi:hypothetical protein
MSVAGGSESMDVAESKDAPQRSLLVHGTEHDVPPESTGTEDSRTDLENRVEVLASEVVALRDQVVELSASLSALRHNLGE